MKRAYLRLEGDRITGWEYPTRKTENTCDYGLLSGMEDDPTDYVVTRDRRGEITGVVYDPPDRTQAEELAALDREYADVIRARERAAEYDTRRAAIEGR